MANLIEVVVRVNDNIHSTALVEAPAGGAVASVNGDTGEVTLAASDVGAVPAYSIDAVSFVGGSCSVSTDSLTTAETGEVAFSFWIRSGNNSGAIWLADPDNYNTEMTVSVTGQNGTGPYAFSAGAEDTTYVSGYTNGFTGAKDSNWHHVIGAFKTTFADGQKQLVIYVDNNDASATLIADGKPSFEMITNAVPFILGYENLTFSIADFWWARGQSFLDSDGTIPESLRHKFISSGRPANLGANGETPTGTAPDIFLHRAVGADETTFANNLGTGGPFSIVGTLAPSIGSPSDLTGTDIGFSNPMTAVGDLMIGGADGAPTRLAAGTEGQVLTMVSGVPTWVTPS